MENLIKYLNSVMVLSQDGLHALLPALTKKDFKKNEFLLMEGQVCNSLFYIDKGYCKSCYTIDGIIKNIAFFFENDIATNIKSFGGQKSELNIIACEQLTVIVFDKGKLFQAAKLSSEIESLGRLCIRLFASKQEEFSNLFKLYFPMERLEFLETHHPYILQRIPLAQLASSLGVARETLSRIRRRRLIS